MAGYFDAKGNWVYGAGDVPGYFDSQGMWHGSKGYKVVSPPPSRSPSRSAPAPVRVPFWDPAPAAYEQFEPVESWSPWDTATIGGAIVPGVVRVRSRKRRKLLTALGVGAQREELTDTGAEASMIEFVCEMWMPAHLDQYATLAAQIELKSGTRGDPRAVSVAHPGLALLKIKQLYIIAVGVPERHGDGGSFYVATIEAQEWKPRRKDDKDGKTFAIDANAKPPPSAIAPRMGLGPPSANVQP